MGVNNYLKAIDSLDNPVAIYQYTNKGKYNTDNYVALTSITDSNGNLIIIPIEINKRGQYNSVEIDINRIKTVYGRETLNYFKNKVANNELKEIYSQKRSTIPSVQFGSHNTSTANNIPQSTQNVNSSTSTKYSMQESQNNTQNTNQPTNLLYKDAEIEQKVKSIVTSPAMRRQMYQDIDNYIEDRRNQIYDRNCIY